MERLWRRVNRGKVPGTVGLEDIEEEAFLFWEPTDVWRRKPRARIEAMTFPVQNPRALRERIDDPNVTLATDRPLIAAR